MNRRTIRGLIVGGVLATAVLVFSAEAKAGCGWRWGLGYGCYSYYAPCYTTCYTPCYVPCYTPACYVGCYRSCFWGWRHRCSYLGCCAPAYVDCCSICGSVTDCGCVEGGGVLYDAPATIPNAQPVEPTPATPEPAGENVLPDPGAAPQASLNGSALLSVRVPTDARVFVNDIPTRSAGEARKYVSQDLAQGFRYTYEVRAEADVDGQTVVQTKTVHLRAGETADLAFVFAVPGETSLTLHVPHNAKVYLAGNETQGAGPVRTFRTTKLNPGATWADYGVRVVLDRDGQQLVETKMINLSAGEQRELTFDFDVDQVASAR